MSILLSDHSTFVRKDGNPAEPKVSECFSEEFIDFLSKNFDFSAFIPIRVKC